MSGAQERGADAPHWVGVVLVAAVLVLVFLLRPGSDTAAQGPAADPSDVAASAAPTDEEFCAEFRNLAEAQVTYAGTPDPATTDLLQESADRLVDLGVPEAMSLPARSGYYTLLSGVYESIGQELDPADVGAAGTEPLPGADGAFSSYLTTYCPA